MRIESHKDGCVNLFVPIDRNGKTLYNSYMDNNGVKAYDCIIIGGGVIGTFAARELARFNGRFLLLEAAGDVSVGTSKANSGIVHAGYDALPGTLKAKFNVGGSRLMAAKCRELEVPYKANGAFVIAFDGTGKRVLNTLKARGIANGVDTEIISGDAARKLEPRLSERVSGALYAPTSAIVSPYELTIACYENFLENGGCAALNSRVTAIERSDFGYRVTVRTGMTDCVYAARTVINAAGLYADDINNLVSGRKRKIAPRRGQYMLLDKTALPVERTIFQTPTALGKGILVTPTCHGNTLVGPDAEDISDKDDVSTTANGLDDVFDRALLSVPTLARRDIITQFSGVRAVCGDDFEVGEVEDGFFNALGICSPGLASSPAIGEYLACAVAQKIGLEENKRFESHRTAIPCFATANDEERTALITRDRRYGNIVCRCEQVTEGEIAEAVRRGAVDLDGVKRRVRAGMGRCQAGFCTPNLIKIIARELGISPAEVTKHGTGSEILGGGQ